MLTALGEDLSTGTKLCHQQDGERAFLAGLIGSVESGTDADRITIVNLYVALKSKPLVILVGQRATGKIALVEGLARALTGGNPIQYQKMIGHAWWAERSENLAFFTQVQTRFNTWKIFALIEEANLPENRNQAHIACLTRISPAEVIGYFSQVAFQLRHSQIMRLPGVHLSSPIPYPRNLFMIGTMDTVQFDWFDEDLLSQTTIIHWPDVELAFSPGSSLTPTIPGGETGFLSSCIRNERAARLKLQRLSGWQAQAMRPLREVESLMMKHGVQLPGSVMAEVNIYLANAWSREGHDLFASSPAHNEDIALDLAISQAVLPRGWETIRRSATLRKGLREVLSNRCPYSQAFLDRLGINNRR